MLIYYIYIGSAILKMLSVVETWYFIIQFYWEKIKWTCYSVVSDQIRRHKSHVNRAFMEMLIVLIRIGLAFI